MSQPPQNVPAKIAYVLIFVALIGAGIYFLWSSNVTPYPKIRESSLRVGIACLVSSLLPVGGFFWAVWMGRKK